MKRTLSLLIMVFMIVSLIIPISIKKQTNNQSNNFNNQVEIVFISNYEDEIDIEELEKEPNKYELAIKEMQGKMKDIDSIKDKEEWFLAYKKIIYEYIELIDPPETIYDYYSEEEINLICRVVETETYQCDFESKVNVANVILNRIEDEKFGNTVREVVTSPSQFAYGRKKISEDTVLAVEYAFMMEDTTNGALYFHSNSTKESFCGRTFIFKDSAGHNFY